MKDVSVLTEHDVDEAQTSTGAPIASDRRLSQRLSFPAIQSMAAYNGRDLPRKAAFVKVVCQDLSRSGVSFLVREKPDFDHAVIAFGRRPRIIYVAARVKNVRPTARGFLVGCSFLHKVAIDA